MVGTEVRHVLPGDIERTSMAVIDKELRNQGMLLAPEIAPVVKRVIQATADFDYARTLVFTDGAVGRAAEALRAGTLIVADTNMARAGINALACERLKVERVCYMADSTIIATAQRNRTTRAVAAMEYAAERHPGAIYAVGNAPTALFALADRIEAGMRPALVIAVPVGFVNTVEAKERVFEVCRDHDVPAIVAYGRKGGSTVATAICNALLYKATYTQDPVARGWA